MTFLGDVFLDKSYKIDFPLNDFVFNLEYPLSCQGTPAKNKINLCQDRSFIKETFGKNPLAVCLANNHIMDYGEEAFEKTIDFLEKEGIKYFGAGNEKNNFNNPCILNMGDKTYALLGYTCSSASPVFGEGEKNGSAKLEKEKVLQDIQMARELADFIVVQLHWGDEEIKYPKPKDVELARTFVDGGADLIIGHHAHVVQTHEIYDGKHIFYGLGNFIFPDFKVNANYNGEKFSGKSQKKQLKRNRKSLIVQFDSGGKVSYETVFFTGKTVQKKDFSVPKKILGNIKEYKFHKIVLTKQLMLEIYLQNPGIPSLRQIKLFLGLDK